MMKKQFVSYSIALKLKELGFNEHCFGMYCQHGDLQNINLFTSNDPDNISKRSSFKLICIALLWQQAQLFLDNKYGFFITLALVANGYGFYIHKNYNTTNKGENYGVYSTLYKSREAAILKAIELCQNKK